MLAIDAQRSPALASIKTAEVDVLQRLRRDYPFFAKSSLKITTKAGGLIAFELNRAQRYFDEACDDQKRRTGMVRKIVVKGRRMGISTNVQGRYYHKLWKAKAPLRAYILTHEQKASDVLFSITKRFADNHEQGLASAPIDRDSAKELVFADSGASYGVATAGSKAVGRGDTIQFFHGCLDLDTVVLGPNGEALRAGDVRVGQLVRTHTGQVAAVSYVSRKRAMVYRLEVPGGDDVYLTAEHKLWTPDGMVEAGELNDRPVGYPVAQILDVVQGVDIPIARRPAHGGGRAGTSSYCVIIDHDVGYFMGLYLADGHMKRGKICLALNETKLAHAAPCLERLSRQWSSMSIKRRRSSLTVEVNIYGARWADFIERECGRVNSKRFPEWWNLGGEAFCEGLLLGYLVGDGSAEITAATRRIRATSVLSALSIGCRSLMASLGYGWAGIVKKPGGVRYGRNERDAWALTLHGEGADALAAAMGRPGVVRKNKIRSPAWSISDGCAWVKPKSFEPVEEREVVDFEVDHSDHSYCLMPFAVSNSEVAYWPNAEIHVDGVMGAVGRTRGTEIILESTANGVGNLFHKMAMAALRGQSEYELIFLPWYWDDTCRLECPATFDPSPEWVEYARENGLEWDQLYWAYVENRTKANATGHSADKPCPSFMQEYPANVEEAFQTSGNSFIPPAHVMRARRPERDVIGTGPVILGIDPSRVRDRVGVIDRCGRRAGQRICSRLDPGGSVVYLANQLAAIIDKIQPDMVNIDVGGVGAGVYDTLVDYGYGDICNAVNFGSNPIGRGPTGDEMYLNRRAEMHDEMRAWFAGDLPVQIPDDDGLQNDLCAPEWGPGACRFNSNNELIIEEKDRIKERLGASPDLSDALCLTFAVPYARDMRSGNNTPIRNRRKSSRQRSRTGY